MSSERIRPFAAALTLVAGLYGPWTAGAYAAGGYSLLQLGGTWVKWGEPALGTSAEVTYALATGPMEFPQARNCGSMVPVGPLLARSRIAVDAFRKEVDVAFREWSRVADISFMPVNDASRADIVIGAQLYPRGRAYSNVAHTAPNAGTSSISKSLICFNPTKKWKLGFDGDLEVYDLRYTLLHEIGHAIGLNHPGPHGQVMSFNYQENFRSLQAGDVTGAHVLYGGAGEPTQTPVRNVAGRAIDQTNANGSAAPVDLSLGKQ